MWKWWLASTALVTVIVGKATAQTASTMTATRVAPAETTRNGGLDSIASRIAGRDFPSIFAPWNIAEHLNQNAAAPPVPLSASETKWATIARHDVWWQGERALGLRLVGNPQYGMLAPSFDFTPVSIQTALQNRATLLAANPHMVMLVAVHYNSAPKNFLPPDSPWWKPDAQFEARSTEYHAQRLDFANPALQDKVAAFCAALVKTGVYDGCMLDGWHDDDETGARVALIKKIRAVIGEQALLVGNVNQRLPTHTAEYLNGMYMEGFGDHYFPDWHLAAANLLWGESHLRKPAITALEGFWSTGRNQYPLMREVTTLALVFSNGSVVFSDPNALPTPDHLHDWYPFWDKSLGKPVGPLAHLDRPDLDGAYTRQFENGEVVFNPPSNRTVTISFPEPRRSAATNVTARSFIVAPGDGDLFLTASASR
jgi:putative glycosyl hydrolase-like family 15 (GHL15) protein